MGQHAERRLGPAGRRELVRLMLGRAQVEGPVGSGRAP
jgi:hypothetical protein